MTHDQTPIPQSVSPVFVGIDVAKDKLDLARSDTGEVLTFVNGAMVFSFVGENPPGEIDGWKYEAITAKTDLAIRFPASLAIGTKVWLIAMWFSHRKETGPASAPVGTNLQGGGVDVSSMRLAA